MIFASDGAGKKILATPNEAGICPSCGADLIAKCGEIYIWHWAHKSIEDCDVWYEPESSWHLRWKRLILPEACEVVMGPHRADMVGDHGLVIELQHSALSVPELLEREKFYKNMIWLFDAEEYKDRIAIKGNRGYETFKWKHPRQSQMRATKPIFWDLGDGLLFRVRGIHYDTCCAGWGHTMEKYDFLGKYLSSVIIGNGKQRTLF